MSQNTAKAEEKDSGGAQGASGAMSEGRIEELEKKLEQLKASVNESSSEMKRTVDDLRKAVVDIRSAVSEIENPFNLLRVITNEKDLGKVIEARPMIEKRFAPKGTGTTETEERVGEEKVAEEQVEAPPAKEEIKEAPVVPQSKASTSVQPDSLEDGAAFLRWVYLMLDVGFDEEILHGLCKYFEYVGIVPRGASDHLAGLISTVVNARSKGLLVEDLELAMYSAAEAVGKTVKPDKISSLLLQVLKRNKLERMIKE
ncbi:MAG: hypothetical protein RMJ07_01625 [Nitrososphaerota archaeon]|nr:hypothetical protein [Candidatus Bathyarchaeota archaeon]MDW8048369.1 hypothetical protein [Nitrososphaerota archaeon]